MAIAVPAVIEEARRRQHLRRRGLGVFLLAAAVAVTATWGSGGLPGGGGPATTTFHSGDGWTITYPSRFHRWVFGIGYGDAIIGGQAGPDRGIAIANFTPIPTYEAVPPAGVLFQLETGNVNWGGAKNVRLPLTLRDFPLFAVDPAHVRQAGPGSYAFQIDGHSFIATVTAGRVASRADLNALSELVLSLRFPHPPSH